MTALTGWENFYVIIGSSAGALIGLQFVVMTLIADMPVGHGTAQASHAFATPTIIHFGAVLLLAGVMSMPWETVTPAAIVWGLLGVAGVGYTAAVTRRMRSQKVYQPEFEDWLFHVLLPGAAYVTLAVSGLSGRGYPRWSLFAAAAAALLLLFVGIHNAWDGVTYHVFYRRPRHQQESEANKTEP